MWRIRVYTFLTVSAFSILYLFTGIVIIFIMPFAFLRLKGAVRFIMRFWARSVFLIIGKNLHIEGRENIKKDGKYILIANHSSLFDIMAIISFFPRVSWFGHARLLKIPVFRQILKMTDYVPMKKASIKNTKEMIDQLIKKSKGHTIAIFPEGTRTHDGKVNEFYRQNWFILRKKVMQLHCQNNMLTMDISILLVWVAMAPLTKLLLRSFIGKMLLQD